MNVQVDAILESLCVNGTTLNRPTTLDTFVAVLGQPSRSISTGPPAPIGHRNNQIHFFDEIGVYLNEHHSTCLINSFDIIFSPLHVPFPTTKAFQDELRLGNLQITSTTDGRQISEDSTISFRPHLGHSWFADGKSLSVDMKTFAVPTKSGRQSRHRLFSWVSIGFHGSHKMAGTWKVVPFV